MKKMNGSTGMCVDGCEEGLRELVREGGALKTLVHKIHGLEVTAQHQSMSATNALSSTRTTANSTVSSLPSALRSDSSHTRPRMAVLSLELISTCDGVSEVQRRIQQQHNPTCLATLPVMVPSGETWSLWKTSLYLA